MTVMTVSLSFSDRDGVQALSLIQSGCDPRCDCPRPPSGLALSGAACKYGHNEPSTGRQRSVSRWIGLVGGIGERGEVIGPGDGGRTQPMSTQAAIVGSTPMTGRGFPPLRPGKTAQPGLTQADQGALEVLVHHWVSGGARPICEIRRVLAGSCSTGVAPTAGRVVPRLLAGAALANMYIDPLRWTPQRIKKRNE